MMKTFLNYPDFALIGTSLANADAIADFERRHWKRQPWLLTMPAVVRSRVRRVLPP